MKKALLLLLVTIAVSPLFAQKVDSLFFHLYTDSLKKGQHNYINVDGKLSNGKWMPMTSKEVQFSCNEAEFKGNELIIPDDFKQDKVTVRVFLKANPFLVIEKTIWIKTKPDGPLPTRDQIMNTPSTPKKTRNKR
ncbi:MAG: hypothetical protein NTW29_20830 [Bacteroidetes bacterium]|nr:hypothetical protein [Bacteroidota bacterium]